MVQGRTSQKRYKQQLCQYARKLLALSLPQRRCVFRALSNTLLSLLFLYIPASFGERHVTVIISDNTPSYAAIAGHIVEQGDANSQVINVTDLTPSIFLHPTQSFITVGSKAFQALSRFRQHITAQDFILSTFIPEQSFQQLSQHFRSEDSIQANQLCALYIDQPLDRQLTLARLILPNAQNLGVALSEKSLSLLPTLLTSAEKVNLNIQTTMIDSTDNSVKKLRHSLSSTDIFLTIPDTTIYTRTTAKWLLYMSLRKRIPLIGFSKKFVDAGAIAAVYSTPEQIGRQTAELIKESRCGGKALYPKYFSISTNKKAAQALKIPLQSNHLLLKAMEQDDE